MPDWEFIFSKRGKVFTRPHSDARFLVSFFKERGIKKILDLGCGSGRHLVYFSKKGFEVFGFDASARALELAKEWLEEEGLTADLKLHRMEERFPYSDNFFDAIISIQVIHHNLLEEILFTVSEMERVLKKNGVIFITVPILKGGSRIDDWQMKEVEPNTCMPLNGPEEGLPHHFFTLEKIDEIFKNFDLLKVYIDNTKHRAILGIKKRES